MIKSVITIISTTKRSEELLTKFCFQHKRECSLNNFDMQPLLLAMFALFSSSLDVFTYFQQCAEDCLKFLVTENVFSNLGCFLTFDFAVVVTY